MRAIENKTIPSTRASTALDMHSLRYPTGTVSAPETSLIIHITQAAEFVDAMGGIDLADRAGESADDE